MTLNFFDRLAAVAVEAPGEVRPRQASRFEQVTTEPLTEEVDLGERDPVDQPAASSAPEVAPNRSITAPRGETRPDPAAEPQPTSLEKKDREPAIVTADDEPQKGSERRPLSDKAIAAPSPPQSILPQSATTNQPSRDEQAAGEERFKKFGEADAAPEMMEISESRSTTINRTIAAPTVVESGDRLDHGTRLEAPPKNEPLTGEFNDSSKAATAAPLASGVQPRPAAPAWPNDAERPSEGEAAGAAQPIIEISIGRIELRPSPADKTAAPPTRPRFQPTVSLDDYLAQRQGESR